MIFTKKKIFAGLNLKSDKQFKTFVESNNMEIVSQNVIQFEPLGLWNGTDCISIFRKPL